MQRLRQKPQHMRAHGRGRVRAETGSALTEFVVVMPIFIMLLFWAEFFVDFGIVKMKMEEATRFALWEHVAQRTPQEIRADVQSRFSDLSSPSKIHSSTPIGSRAFKSISIANVDFVENIDEPFAGSVQLNGGSNGGVLTNLMQFLGTILGKAVDSLARSAGFETKRGIQASVEFQVQNTLFPGGRLLTGFFDPGQATALTIKGKSPMLLWDTWKAWPGRFSRSSTSVNTDPYSTYARGGASAPEVEVAARMRNLAFLNQGGRGIFSGFASVVRAVGLADPTARGHWKDKSGPIVMLPGEPANQTFSPAQGAPLQRYGDRTVNSNAVTTMGSVARGTDRARSTVPSSTIHTGWWTAEGGIKDGQTSVGPSVAAQTFTPQQNGYARMYGCRSSFYLGAATPGVKRWGVANPNRDAFPNCQQ